MHNGRRRVVITGLGTVNPLGNSVADSWKQLIAGESGAAEITQFDHSESYNVHFACELKEFDPTQWIDRKAARRMDRFAQMILAAARQAEADSGLDIAKEPERCGASIATGIGGLRSYQECYDVLLARGPDRVSPFSIPSIIPNMGAGWVSIELGTKGPLMSECTACAASHMAEPDPTGENPARAMRMALEDAATDPAEVGYINAHATSTPLGDASETRVIKRALGDENAARTPVSSTKGATGHCFGAAGAIEAVFTTLAIRDKKLPPTINYEVEDPECDLDYVPNESRDAPSLHVGVSNSFGFGGHNATIVIRTFDE